MGGAVPTPHAPQVALARIFVKWEPLVGPASSSASGLHPMVHTPLGCCRCPPEPPVRLFPFQNKTTKTVGLLCLDGVTPALGIFPDQFSQGRDVMPGFRLAIFWGCGGSPARGRCMISITHVRADPRPVSLVHVELFVRRAQFSQSSSRVPGGRVVAHQPVQITGDSHR